MKKFLKLALIAIVAFASNNVFAQETIDMNLYGLKDKTWTVGQSLDGVSYTDEKSEIEISFSKGDGTADLPLSNMTPRKTALCHGLQTW